MEKCLQAIDISEVTVATDEIDLMWISKHPTQIKVIYFAGPVLGGHEYLCSLLIV